MKLQWLINDKDVTHARELVEAHAAHPLVLSRQRNVDGTSPPVTLERFWVVMVGCLLSTQQRSGVGSRVQAFLMQRPFPLDYESCVQMPDVRRCVSSMLSAAGIRRGESIANQIENNRAVLREGARELLQLADSLRAQDDRVAERRVARVIDDQLDGFGPKQSRNLLQTLGLTRYELPVDSRITRWLNSLGVYPTLKATALADSGYYELVLDGLIELAESAGTWPCVLDAAVFASFEPQTTREAATAWDQLFDSF